jgi:predicted alpha/beta superfamily hydrolase
MKFVYLFAACLSIGSIFSVNLPGPVIPEKKSEESDRVYKIHSRILNEERILRISLPDSYDKTQDRYPVLYQLDGSDRHFSEVTHTIQSLCSAGKIPEMIVVGIANTDRWRDMLPINLKKHPTSGEADRFLEFLEREVIRFLEENYLTNRVRILSGRSNSALFTIFAMTAEASVFDGYIASSPSLGHCRDYVFDRTASFLNSSCVTDRAVFISNGGLDAASRLISPIPELIDMLKNGGPESIIWKYRYYEKEGHCPSPTLRDGLIWLFQHLRTGLVGYLNMPPPGFTPECFAPGLISTTSYAETGCAFTPDGKEFYFTRSGGNISSSAIFVSIFENDRWTQPERASFTGFGPCVSPDGKKIFVSRYGTAQGNQRRVELWFANRIENEWSVFKFHGPGNRPSISGLSNLYYLDRSNEEDRGVIAVQNFMDGKSAESRIPGGGINTPYYDAHPCIANDESYIIFDSNRPGGYGEGDLYVCFRNEDGTWGNAINLGSAINTKSYEAYSSISPDRKYLFYSSNINGNFDIYWVDLRFIENLKK